MLRIFASILGAAILLVFICSGTGKSEDEEEKCEEIKSRLTQEKIELKTLWKKIKDKKSRIQETQKKEKRVVSELNRIEKELLRKQRDLKRYESSLKKKKEEVKNINNEIEKLQAEITEQENSLLDCVKALYKLGRMDMTKALFSSDSFPGLIRRYKYMSRVIDYNLMVIDDYSKKLVMIQQHEQRLRDNEKKLEGLTEKTRSTQKKILYHQKEKTTLLAKVKSEKELHLSALEELKHASNRLQSLIDKLEKGTTPVATLSPGFSKEFFFALKGKLGFPVEGNVITYFGKHEDPEFSTVSFNKGIEIVARQGSPIKAILDGKVIYSGWFKGYGNIIIIDHGAGYYTLSGHASELFKKVGDQVEAGESIGLVGDTGSLRGANLYFEVRHHGQPLDPLDWLKQD